MKKLFIAALAVCAAFASCSKEDNGGQSGEKAKLTIGVSAPAGSRATGTLTDETDNAVGEFKAYVFAGEVLQAIMTSSNGAAVTEEAKVTTAANAIYVIANANAVTALSGVAEGTTSKTAFLALAGELLNGTTFAAKSTAGNVWASGYTALSSSDFGTNNTATKSVAVSPIPARINVTVTDNRDNKSQSGAYAITHVQVLNAAGTTPFIAPASFVTPTIWHTGNTATAPTVYNAYFNDAYNASGHLFYTFENASSETPTIVTLVTSDGTNTRYYPVHFTLADAQYTIERGKSYQVEFTLNGDATDDTDITDPEVPVVLATLEVSVTPTNWMMVPISKEF